MKSLAIRYTKYFNSRYARSGTIWNERYRSRSVQDERYALACLRYIEQNPLRAHIVSSPEQYRWSSYGASATGEFPPWLTPHPVYLSLAETPADCRRVYRTLCGELLSAEQLVDQRYRGQISDRPGDGPVTDPGTDISHGAPAAPTTRAMTPATGSTSQPRSHS